MADINDFIKNANIDSLEQNPDGKGLGINVTDEFIKNMTDSDKPNCEYKRGDSVVKATWEPGDACDIGTKGIILGTLYEKTLGEAYLVIFEINPVPMFIVKAKIKRDE